jgi:hypothetical protein
MGGLLVPVVLAISLCGSGKPAIAVSYGVQHDVDTGLQGNAWADLTYTRAVRVWRTGTARFCAVSTYDGTFTSLAGPSPGGRWQLPAGIRGTLAATSKTTFRGRLTTRALPLHGFLGVKDFAAGTWEWMSDYFGNVTGFKYTRYSFTYHATENGSGTFANRLVNGKEKYSGDIKAARPKPRR